MSASVHELPSGRGWGAGATYAIEIEGLTARSGSTTVLKHLSLHVPAGSVYGLAGPAGSGKSTLLRVLATLQAADAGRIIVDGIDLRQDPSAVRRRIGYLPETSGLYEALTVAEHIDFYAGVHGIAARRRRRMTDELIELVRLSAHRDSAVKSLSRGMRQNLRFARCLVHDPRILLLDDPTTGMDTRSRLEIHGMLQELAHLGKSVLVCSPVLSDLVESCTHLGILADGGLVVDGTVNHVLDVLGGESRVYIRLAHAEQSGLAHEVLRSTSQPRSVESPEPLALLARYDERDPSTRAIAEQLDAAGVEVTHIDVDHPTLDEALVDLVDPPHHA